MTTADLNNDTQQFREERNWLDVLGAVWAWIFLLVLIVFFSVASDAFLSLRNFQNILANMSILAILAFGQTFVIISAGIDLSTGFVMGMVAVVSALAMTSLPPEWPLLLIVLVGALVGIGAGLIAGLVNGLLIARLNVPPFIATLGMFGIARGVGFLLSNGMPVPIQIPGLGHLGNGYLAYFHPDTGLSWIFRPENLERTQMRDLQSFVPFVVIFMLVLLAIAHFTLSRTKFGLTRMRWAAARKRRCERASRLCARSRRSISSRPPLRRWQASSTTCASQTGRPTQGTHCCWIRLRPSSSAALRSLAGRAR